MEKFKGYGLKDNFKIFIVAHGNEQDTMLNLDCSSPAAQMHSMMTCLVVAACNNLYAKGKLDIKVLSYKQRCLAHLCMLLAWLS